MLLTMSLNVNSSLCILGRRYILGILETRGHNFLLVSSVGEDLLCSSVNFFVLHPWGPWQVFYFLCLPERRRFSVCSLKCSEPQWRFVCLLVER